MTSPSSKTTYFLTPGWDCPLNSIPLGSVITNPAEPNLTLFRPSPDDLDTPIQVKEIPLFSSTVGNNNNNLGDTGTLTNGVRPGQGLFYTFLTLSGLGIEDDSLTFHIDRRLGRNLLAYSFRGLRVSWFEPSDALKRKAVHTALQEGASASPEPVCCLYMVTGIRTISGAGVTVPSARRRGCRVELAVELEPDIDPDCQSDGRLSLGEGGGEGEREGLPVVFAFELRELRVSPQGEVTLGDVFRDNCECEGSRKESSIAELQAGLDRDFGEGVFVAVEGFDEQDGKPCRIVAPSPACVDLLTAGSARIDRHSVMHTTAL